MAIDLIMRIAGEGGEGVISSGDFLMQAATRSGMEVVTFKTFPAEIKGGYALSQVRISDEKILSQGDTFNILVAFNGEAYAVNKKELVPGTVIVYDCPGDFEAEELPGVHMYPVPMTQISKEVLKSPISKNMVALGAVSELFNVPLDSLKSSLTDKFIRKGQKVVDSNLAAIDAGIQYVKDNLKKTDDFTFPKPQPKKDVIIVEGSQAVALGGMAAGCKYFSCYPITPATTVANYMSEMMLKANGYVYQAEDEIASIANVLGASFGGVKSMTSTSGPGIDLMSELLGLGAMTEIPCVIINVMRGGPSTGMPTKHDQADLLSTAYCSHGDTPKIILAASDVADNFYLTVDAFNLAEKYQMPVFMLSDASLAIRTEAIPIPDISKLNIIERENSVEVADETKFLRYINSDSGISPMGKPGVGGTAYAATGLEHAEDSGPRTTIEVKEMMTDKRWRKFENLEEDYDCVLLDEEEGAEIGIIAWGLTASITKEAVKRLRDSGKKVSALYPKVVFPAPMKSIQAFADKVGGKVLLPEANYKGQLAHLIKANSQIEVEQLNVYRGEPFIPKEIEEFIQKNM